MQETLYINLFYLLLFATIIWITIQVLKYRYSKQVIGKVLVQMHPSHSPQMMALCKIENDKVYVKYDGVQLLEGIKYKDLDANDKVEVYECTRYDVLPALYPYGAGLFRFMSVPCSKVILRQGQYIPISRLGDEKPSTLDPERRRQETNIKFRTAVDIANEASEKEKQAFIEASHKIVNPTVIYAVLGACVIAMIVCIYFVYGLRDDMSAVRYAVGQ